MALDKPQLVQMLRTMILIREFDELAIKLRVAGKIYGAVHPYVGQEAVAVGVCSTLTVSDRVTSTHRGHGHCIAKGADIRRMMAELFGRVDGYCKGKGGSMHIADFAVGMLGANGIVGGGLPIACGAALAAQLEGKGDVTVCFFGDGAAAEGEFHEALNIASLWKLPIVFVCENNQYAANNAVGRAASARGHRRPRRRLRHARRHRRRQRRAGGSRDARARRSPAPAAARARASSSARPIAGTSTPCAPPCPRRRARPTRSRRGRPAIPIARFEQHLLGRGVLSAAEIAAIRERVHGRSRRRGGLRRGQPVSRSEGSAGRHVRRVRRRGAGMREISFQKALDEAVAEEMRRDPRVITMGTDFTGDPVKEFGPARVRFTPISEAVLTGMGLGAAGCGFRPIVNWRMVTFSFVAMDQIVNQASKIRYMFGGQADFPGDLPLLDGRRHRPRRAALAEPVLDVDASRGAEDHPPVDAGRRQGAAQERDPRQQSRGLLRVQPAGHGRPAPCPTAIISCRSASRR